MKKVSVLVSVLLVFAGPVFAGVCSQGEAALLASVERSSQRGEVTSVEVNQAKENLLEARYQCGEISKAEFCSAAPAVVKKVLDVVLEGARIGEKTSGEIIAAQREVRAVTAVCK